MGESVRILDRFKRQNEFRNADFLHCIITRFDVQLPWAEFSKGRVRFSVHNEWLAERVKVFNSFCLPSVLNQRVLPHAWFVLIDRDLNRRTSRLMSNLVQYPFIIPMLVGQDWNQEFAEEFQGVCARRFGGREYGWVNSVRLDSDDSLHRDFMCASDLAIARLRKDWQPESRYCVNFPFGAMRVDSDFFVVLRPKHFFSLIEPVEKVRGMYGIAHTKVERIAEVTDVYTRDPMYVYQRHDTNNSGLGNYRAKLGPRLCDTPLLCESFGIQSTISQAPPSNAHGGAADRIG